MRKLLTFFFMGIAGVGSMLLSLAVYATTTFSVTEPTIQNMVPNSIQNLIYTLSTKVPGTITIHCSFKSSKG